MYANYNTSTVGLMGLDSPLGAEGDEGLGGIFGKSFFKRMGGGLVGAGTGYLTGGGYGALVGGASSAIVKPKGGILRTGVRSIVVGGTTGALTGAALAAGGYKGDVGIAGRFTQRQIQQRQQRRRAQSKLIGPLPRLTTAERLSGLLPTLSGVQRIMAGGQAQPTVMQAGAEGFGDLFKSPMTLLLIGGGVIAVVALSQTKGSAVGTKKAISKIRKR